MATMRSLHFIPRILKNLLEGFEQRSGGMREKVIRLGRCLMRDVSICGADEKWLERESMGLSDGLKVAMQLISEEFSSSLEVG